MKDWVSHPVLNMPICSSAGGFRSLEGKRGFGVGGFKALVGGRGSEDFRAMGGKTGLVRRGGGRHSGGKDSDG